MILKEQNPEKAVFRMRELHELRFIHPDLKLPRAIEKRFDEAEKWTKWYESEKSTRKRKLDKWLMNFMILLDPLPAKQTEDVLAGFVFTNSETARVMSYKQKGDNALRKLSSQKKMKPSDIYKLLEPFSHEVTLCILAKARTKIARSRIKKFFTVHNGMRLKISGKYIQKEGIKPGPRYKKILDYILCKKLDGKVLTKQDEIACMRKVIEEQKRKRRKK